MPAAPELPRELPTLRLQHGEALAVMAHLGFKGAASESTFYEYVKSLRKLGTPFDRGKLGYARRGLANYSYSHLMELALVLTLRVYHVVPDSLLREIVRHRPILCQYYDRAYTERSTGIGEPIAIRLGAHEVELRGAYLDLQINFSGGILTSFGPPRLLSPAEAFHILADREHVARPLLPLNLSHLAERLVSAAFCVPTIRRGPRPRSGSRQRRSGTATRRGIRS